MIGFVTKLARKILALQPSKDISDGDLEYLLWICSIYHKLDSIPGHIAEVGVAGGRNAVFFGRLIKIFGHESTRQYVGFDTFEGYAPSDLARDKHLAAGNDRWKAFSKTSVLERCSINGIDDLVELFEGNASIEVPRVLSEHRGKKFQPGKARFALVYIDCNAYTPAINSLRAFLPYLMPGAYIVIDEKLQGGESEAMIDFAMENGLSVIKPGNMQVPMLLKLKEGVSSDA
jgi:hypothetical protein